MSKYRTNQVRIIGGLYRGRKITFSDAEGLRPTADSVRERLFNWLGQNLQGKKALDLFSGSGVMGLEAVSRGASDSTLVESNRHTARDIQKNLTLLGIQNARVLNQDALVFLDFCSERFDVVFVDPPYAWDSWAELFPRLIRILNPYAQVYLEAGVLPALPDGWRIDKQGRSGKSQFVLLSQIVQEE